MENCQCAIFTLHRTNVAFSVTPGAIVIMLEKIFCTFFIFSHLEEGSMLLISRVIQDVAAPVFIDVSGMIKLIMDHLNCNICLRMAKCRRLS